MAMPLRKRSPGRILWCLLPIIVLIWCGPAQANDRNFSLINQTAQTITGLWTSTQNDNIWHWVKGFQSIGPDGSSQIVFDNSGPCQIQFQIRLNDGSEHSWPQGVNLCQNGQVTVTFDNNTGIYSVSYK
jgi:hypothetical protein